MRKNFHVGQSNELVAGDRVIDLHNEFDFSELSLTPYREVRLFFVPHPVHGKGQAPVVLEFVDVDFFELSAGFGTRIIQDLEEVGYIKKDQVDDSWLLGEDQATADDHLLFRLGADHIRVHSRQAHLREHR